ncbi:MAG: hypothetical protein LBH40_02120 [Alphaproteobacteria bacterium]|jgi:lipopolysaccharide biosynthesis glycosyltransferase|nr:hypothetical protein [Alphaproteobacteria bacterium]
MQNEYSIAFSISRSHLLFAMVTLYSLLKNNQKYTFNVYILHDNCLKQKEIDNICNQFPLNQYNNLKINLVDVSNLTIIKQLPNPNLLHHSWSKDIYFRLFLSVLLPNVDKILYLDTDVLIRGDITDFFETDMGNNCFLGDADISPVVVCSGVLLMNLKELRNYNILKELTNEIMLNPTTTDQSFINKVYKNTIITTPPYYIFNTGILNKLKNDYTKIIHFTVPITKPYFSYGFKFKDLKQKGIIEYFTYFEDFIEPKYKWKFKLEKLYIFYCREKLNSLRRRATRFYYKYILKNRDFHFYIKNERIYKYAIIKKS